MSRDGPRRTRRELLSASVVLASAGLAGCTSQITSRSDGGRASRNTDTGSDLPTTGDAVPELSAFDETVRGYMAEHDIPGGLLGVAKDGQILLERGYGYCDAAREKPMQPDTFVRIASLSKAFTRVAVRQLVREGRLDPHEQVFPLLDLDPLPGERYNDRLDAITVAHLLRHHGGWDRQESYDPMFTQLEIALERGWEEPPDKRRIARYMTSEPLQFEPGQRRAYSNFGYSLLGQVVETVTGMDYQRYLEREVFDPAGIADVELGRSLPANRPDRESWYFGERTCRNVVDVNPLELVRCPDGGFHLEATDASGGHVATVRALLSFMAGYWLDGRRRTPDSQFLSFDGALPGAFSLAIQHPAGVDVALVFNRRGYDPNYLDSRTELLGTVDEIETWPR